MSAEERPIIPRAQIVYGEIVYWITIAACIICMIGPLIAMASPKNNVADPWFLFAEIFAGKDAHAVWEEVAGEFPGGHFWAKNFTKGDGFTQFGLALGCSVAIWGLLAAAVMYLVSDKVYLYVVLALWVASLVFLSASGIVGGSH
jgi:hypothetical protein